MMENKHLMPIVDSDILKNDIILTMSFMTDVTFYDNNFVHGVEYDMLLYNSSDFLLSNAQCSFLSQLISLKNLIIPWKQLHWILCNLFPWC